MHLEAMLVPDLPAGCPWAEWARPNVKWCESNLCRIIVAPANTWSNLAYIVAAWVMWKQAGCGRPSLRLFSVAALLVGLGSFAYHASYTYVFQVADFIGMFCFACISVVLNLRRLGVLGRKSLAPTYFAAVGVCSLLLYPFGRMGLPIQAIVLALVVMDILEEAWLLAFVYSRHPRLRPRYERYATGMLALAVGFCCSMADLTRVWCEPDNHLINGHSAWHLLTALSLYSLFLFYSQFALDGEKERLPLAVHDV